MVIQSIPVQNLGNTKHSGAKLWQYNSLLCCKMEVNEALMQEIRNTLGQDAKNVKSILRFVQ